MTKNKKQDDEFGPEMKLFRCVNCEGTYADTKLYFHDTPSTKCIACTKFPDRLKKKRVFN